MKKGLFIIVTGTLLLAGSAQAHRAPGSIGWAQNFEIGAVNQVDWLGGVGSASGLNRATFEQIQQFSTARSEVSALQRQTGRLMQSASASGLVGPSTSRQEATVNGDQALWARGGRFPSAGARQSLDGTFVNQVVKPDGIGEVSGTQRYTGLQEQSLSTPNGNGLQSQSVEIVQRANITTGADTDPVVTSTINLQLSQSQMAQ
ncbi:MAG: hypothetical protein JXB13_08930 [Phycisphaerae bacterium]|nr:hypothetical protein [Phycisphaerae bacterium]